MPRRDPAKAVELIDYLLAYYADGLHWRHPDPEGNLSLPEALHYLRRPTPSSGMEPAISFRMRCRGAQTSLRSAAPAGISGCCAVIELARAMALLEWRKRRAIERQRTNIEVERRRA